VKILYTSRFKKHFKARIRPNSNLVIKFEERFDLFLKSPNDPNLKEHALKGTKRRFRAFSITGDIRVIYRIDNSDVIFYDIGSHNQVY